MTFFGELPEVVCEVGGFITQACNAISTWVDAIYGIARRAFSRD
jgi:hypothetical protein